MEAQFLAPNISPVDTLIIWLLLQRIHWTQKVSCEHGIRFFNVKKSVTNMNKPNTSYHMVSFHIALYHTVSWHLYALICIYIYIYIQSPILYGVVRKLGSPESIARRPFWNCNFQSKPPFLDPDGFQWINFHQLAMLKSDVNPSCFPVHVDQAFYLILKSNLRISIYWQWILHPIIINYHIIFF